jgi:hypothetical protein
MELPLYMWVDWWSPSGSGTSIELDTITWFRHGNLAVLGYLWMSGFTKTSLLVHLIPHSSLNFFLIYWTQSVLTTLWPHTLFKSNARFVSGFIFWFVCMRRILAIITLPPSSAMISLISVVSEFYPGYWDWWTIKKLK